MASPRLYIKNNKQGQPEVFAKAGPTQKVIWENLDKEPFTITFTEADFPGQKVHVSTTSTPHHVVAVSMKGVPPKAEGYKYAIKIHSTGAVLDPRVIIEPHIGIDLDFFFMIVVAAAAVFGIPLLGRYLYRRGLREGERRARATGVQA